MRKAGVGLGVFTKIICEACCKHPNECLTVQMTWQVQNPRKQLLHPELKLLHIKEG